MTPPQMSISTLQQLADLSPTTKADLIEYLKNKLGIVIMRADGIESLVFQPLPSAVIIAKTARQTLEELKTLLK